MGTIAYLEASQCVSTGRDIKCEIVRVNLNVKRKISLTVLFWRVFKSRKKLIYTVEMGTTVIYGWFWGFAKGLYCRGVLKGEDRDSETRVVD